MTKLLIILLFTVLVGFTNAQEMENIKSISKGTRFVNSQGANLAEKGELLLLIQHRFGDISNGLYQLFGLDQATMRIGFEYGFGDNINLGFGRSTFMKTYDVFGKYRLTQQSNNFPLTLVATASGSIPTIRDIFPETYDNFSDKFSGNVQLHIARTFNNFGIQLSPGYLKSGYLFTENENISTAILGVGGSVKVSKKVTANIEYLHTFSDELSSVSPLSLGIDLDTGGHLFQLVLSNSQTMFDQALFTNTRGDWAKGNVFFGFNLVREFDINKAIDF